MNIPKNIKNDFPIFTSHTDLVYLDSAATSQKPQQVISAVTDFYTKYNSNVHRGVYTLSQQATELYENARKKVAAFIGADNPAEVIFTGNASEAINLVAYGYARKYLSPGDYVVLSEMEHHSNIVSWLRLRDEKGVQLYFLPLNKDYSLNYQQINSAGIPKEKIKLVTLTHASNVLGTINPVGEIIAYIRGLGINAKFCIDGAQAAPHISVNIRELNCDFYVFSGHKMLGPSGVGVLWAKEELLKEMDPLFVGSHMIRSVTKEKAVWADVPDKFETGTGKLEAVIGLGAAVDYLQKIGLDNVYIHEQELTQYALHELQKIDGIDLYGSQKVEQRLAVFSFNIKGIHPHDVAEILNRRNICVRAGHHCAQPLLQALGTSSTVRASFYLYNTKEDVDTLVEGIGEVKKVFRK